ncbi:hypothetical protein NM688_g3544 [Phlebia brevispora]|uniref:Uncharacterized protein n=1 Tax=Phlebia brevispora TaxID=194682 RepID=A0ACC1T5D7_9APHY|nr:hypothetical protein NM688_g3544 [Phlebia brevispora]
MSECSCHVDLHTDKATVEDAGQSAKGWQGQQDRVLQQKIYLNRERFPLSGNNLDDSDSQPVAELPSTPTFMNGKIQARAIKVQYMDVPSPSPSSTTNAPGLTGVGPAEDTPATPSLHTSNVLATSISPNNQTPPINNEQPVNSNNSEGSIPASISAAIAAQDGEPVLEVRPFRDAEGCTRWWQATGFEIISQPPAGLAVELADLYVYKARCTDKIYTWVYREEGWRRILPGQRHPISEVDRVLSWRGKNHEQPTWVTYHTYSTYQSRVRGNSFRRNLLKHDRARN